MYDSLTGTSGYFIHVPSLSIFESLDADAPVNLMLSIPRGTLRGSWQQGGPRKVDGIIGQLCTLVLRGPLNDDKAVIVSSTDRARANKCT